MWTTHKSAQLITLDTGHRKEYMNSAGEILNSVAYSSINDAGWQTEVEAGLSTVPVGILFGHICSFESLRPVLWTAVTLQTSGELN